MSLSRPPVPRHVNLDAGLRLAEPRLLSDDDWPRPAGAGSDRAVPTVPPLRHFYDTWEGCPAAFGLGGALSGLGPCSRRMGRGTELPQQNKQSGRQRSRFSPQHNP
ncbi:hypothetical protein EYF80_042951 [Liparis tanakae]|uniref:Uncharacterized protein n=1 Tax=Liparis tanakae TaxID=230148 RepID=A0A4Z2G2V2_9TELE|nr:hypothetical protein EYF80_042951 [Liparis tanakae]